MWRDDQIYFDTTDQFVSLTNNHPRGNFENFSERYERCFKADFTLGTNLKLMPKHHLLVNFKWLKELLTSKDLNRLEELSCLSLKFLDSSIDMSGQKIAFASYPRTGNSFVRSFLEKITGIATGSDMPLFITAA